MYGVIIIIINEWYYKINKLQLLQLVAHMYGKFNVFSTYILLDVWAGYVARLTSRAIRNGHRFAEHTWWHMPLILFKERARRRSSTYSLWLKISIDHLVLPPFRFKRPITSFIATKAENYWRRETSASDSFLQSGISSNNARLIRRACEPTREAMRNLPPLAKKSSGNLAR
jgi:hypothetical protein